MEFDFQNLLEMIGEAECITLFRHEHPDCDALGSQWALASWIHDNFPEKKVYALGEETTDQCAFPDSSRISDETVKQSTAIVLDTANTARIDDQRALTAAKLVKVDHHPNREPFGTPCLVFDHAAATCEILAEFFHQNRDTFTVSEKTAMYLYRGLLTDTLCYRTSNTTSHTLEMGSYLVSLGIDLSGINRELFDVSYDVFRFQNWFREQASVRDGIAYAVLKKDELAGWHMTGSQARNYIDELGHVKEFQIWAVFTESDEHPGLFHGSLRSKTVRINDIAERHNGGGHPNASGVKNLTEEDIQNLLHEFSERLKNR